MGRAWYTVLWRSDNTCKINATKTNCLWPGNPGLFLSYLVLARFTVIAASFFFFGEESIELAK